MQEVLPPEEDRRKALEAQLSAVRDRDLAGHNACFWKEYKSRLEMKDSCKQAAVAIKTATAPKALWALSIESKQ